MKKIFIIIITAIVSSVLTVFGYWEIQQFKNPKVKEIDSPYGLNEIKEIDYEMPSFYLVTTGLVITVIGKESLSNIKTYELSATISDSISKQHHVYKGIKVKDVIDSLNFDKYNKIVFKSNGGLQVEYKKEELDDVFFVFEKDNISYPEKEPVGLFNATVYDRYNITNIEKIEFTL